MTEFVVNMEHRPGQLAALTEALAEVGVNLDALAAYGYDGSGVVRFIADDAITARHVLQEASLQFEERRVLTSHMPKRPGELATLTRSLADAGVNIEALYVLHADADGIEFAIVVDEPDTALPHLDVTGGALAS